MKPKQYIIVRAILRLHGSGIRALQGRMDSSCAAFQRFFENV
jgi:hypothetical protein